MSNKYGADGDNIWKGKETLRKGRFLPSLRLLALYLDRFRIFRSKLTKKKPRQKPVFTKVFFVKNGC